MAKKMVIFCGSDNPEKAFPPFMLGIGAQVMDMELMMFFTMSGLNIVRKGGIEKIKLKGAPKPLPDFLNDIIEGGAKLVACSAVLDMVGMKKEELIDGVEFGGVATFVDEAETADIVLTF
ncbi:MAG: DsrE/DsrF/DrsH-like family protein [candidate division Zixibacteria bacterium]|nr:DsrE/DsrF/DrsH-like family protein [candidate division Zixibacteria bacterium]